MIDLFMTSMLILVSLLWGITNPLLKKYSAGVETIKAESYLWQTLSEMKFLISQPMYVLSFLLNQLGGVVFVSSLASADLSLAVPLTNGLTFLVTTVTGQWMLKEEGLGPLGWLGVVMLSTGIGLCIAGKS